MRHTTVINNAPWVSAIGIGLLAASFYVQGPLSMGLMFAASMVLSAACAPVRVDSDSAFTPSELEVALAVVTTI